jgi:hypothetical protein
VSCSPLESVVQSLNGYSEYSNSHLGKETVVCTYMVRSYPVSVQCHVMPTKLVNFKTNGFGVTLGMGWISIYNTCVDQELHGQY